MRILIISTYFPPLNSIASLRPYSWAKTWGQNNHDVTVLTTVKQSETATSLKLPTENFKIVAVPFPSWLTRLKIQYHSNIHKSITSPKTRCKKYLTDFFYKFYYFLRYKKGLFNTCRMPDFSDFWIRHALKAVENDIPWDLVISSAGPYATHIVAARIKKRKQARLWIADYRDAWSDSRIYPGLFPFNLLESWLEKKLIRQADMITTVCEPFAQRYAIKFPHIRTETIENGFDPNDLIHLSEQSIFPNDGKFRIVYTGSFYTGKQDPSPLFQAIDIILNDAHKVHLLDRLEVLFIGPDQRYLHQLVAKHNVGPWVQLQGFINREDTLRMQRDAHLLLFLAWNDPATNGIMTGKLFEYLYSKTPILSISNHGIEASQQLILEANAGITFIKPADIAAWLCTQLISPIKNCSKIDPKILQRYDRRILAEKLLNHILIKSESLSF